MKVIRQFCLAAAACAAFAPAAAIADEPLTFDEKGLTLDVAGDDLTFNLGGRLHVDAASFDDELTLFDDDVRVRRARLELGGTVLKDWNFRVDYEFSSIGEGFKNAWLSYRGLDGFEFTGGNFIAPFSLEDLEGSNALPAMERSLAQALAPGFLVGGQAKAYRKHWSLTAGYFFNPIALDPTVNNDAGESIIARATLAPLNSGRQTLHFGAGFERRNLDAGAPTRVRTFPQSGIAGARLIDTGALADVDSFVSLGLEAAYRYRNVMLRGQYIRRDNDAPLLGDPKFQGGYVEATWVLTGERRAYSERNGAFGGVRPKSKLGAVELVGRFSTLDLDDALVTGGEEQDYLAGVNWYLGRNFRIMGNYVHARATPNRDGFNESTNIYQARAQLNF